MNNSQLRGALGLSVTVIASEHYFSTYLSSPWSVDTFAKTEKDRKTVWSLFWEASVWSMGFAIVMSAMLRTWYPIISCIVVIAGYYWVYDRALKHKLVKEEELDGSIRSQVNV